MTETNNKSPKISVIVPVYNVEKYVRKCIESVINQTYSNLEIIIINDGSQDKSGNICEELARKDNRIIYFKQQNKGVSAARNVGIKNATGDWIYFLDADDYLDLNFCKDISFYFKDSIDVIQFGIRSFLNRTQIGERKASKFIESLDFNIFFSNLELKPLSACLHITRRDLIDKNNIFYEEDMKHNEDMLFMYKILALARGYIILDKVFYNQVLSENSATRSPVKPILIENRLMLVDRLIEFNSSTVKNKMLYEEANNLLKGFFVEIARYNGIEKLNKAELNKTYRNFYVKNKNKLTTLFSKLASIHISTMLIPLKIKYILLNK